MVIEACARCSRRLKVIASIEDPEFIERILAHLDRTSGTQQPELAPLAAQAPPVGAPAEALIGRSSVHESNKEAGGSDSSGRCSFWFRDPDRT